MDLVVDANILFAALVKNSTTSDIMFSDNMHLYTPEFIFTEFEKYKELLKSKTKRTYSDFENLMDLFQRRIAIIPLEEIKAFVGNAKKISPDVKDIPYVALALKLNASIWSNDKALKEKQDLVKVYSTEDLIKILK